MSLRSSSLPLLLPHLMPREVQRFMPRGCTTTGIVRSLIELSANKLHKLGSFSPTTYSFVLKIIAFLSRALFTPRCTRISRWRALTPSRGGRRTSSSSPVCVLTSTRASASSPTPGASTWRSPEPSLPLLSSATPRWDSVIFWNK
jgi:hypothetical protein